MYFDDVFGDVLDGLVFVAFIGAQQGFVESQMSVGGQYQGDLFPDTKALTDVVVGEFDREFW